MAISFSSSSPEQQTSKYSGSTLMPPQWKNGATASHKILPNIPARLSNFLPSDPLLPNQTHPVPGNQGCILPNMARTHIEANFELSPGIIDHRKRAPGPAETTTSGSSSCKYNTFFHQSRGGHKWSTPPAIWSNWTILFWPNWKFSSAIRQKK